MLTNEVKNLSETTKYVSNSKDKWGCTKQMALFIVKPQIPQSQVNFYSRKLSFSQLQMNFWLNIFPEVQLEFKVQFSDLSHTSVTNWTSTTELQLLTEVHSPRLQCIECVVQLHVIFLQHTNIRTLSTLIIIFPPSMIFAPSLLDLRLYAPNAQRNWRTLVSWIRRFLLFLF